MDEVRCSLCGRFFNPKHGHSCGWEDDLFANQEKLIEYLYRSMNIESEGNSDLRAENDSELSLLENDQNNIFSHPDQSSASPATPVSIHRSPPDVSTYFQLPSTSDASAATSSAVQVETSQGVISRADDNRSNTSCHFPSEIAGCSTDETGDHLSVVTAPEVDPVAGPSGHRARHPRNDERKPFVCDKCNRGFSDSSNLRKHLRTHTGEKPFVCKECGKAFAQNSSLRKHLRTHSKKNPFVCSRCGRAFSDIFSLWRHFQTHTGENPFE